jgi:hypothetical protein
MRPRACYSLHAPKWESPLAPRECSGQWCGHAHPTYRRSTVPSWWQRASRRGGSCAHLEGRTMHSCPHGWDCAVLEMARAAHPHPHPTPNRGRSRDSNPGAATPYSLYKMYKAQGAVMANPCTLRQQFGASHLRPLKIAALAQRSGTSAPRLPTTTTFQNSAGGAKSSASSRRPSESPACMSFTTLQQRGAADTHSLHDIRLSLDSLTMERMSMRRL